MKPFFVGHPVATALLVGTLCVWTVIEVRQALNRRVGAKNTDRGSLLILRACAAAGALLAAFALRVPVAAFPYNAVIFGISLAVVWAGVCLRCWCFQRWGVISPSR